ncbi:hypothetical protein NDU88_007737 [Pleurodeles waltl]|uniref:Uncharacterized protein n=1 Tax=Pleurodeles waltl TaxID=8319 RepID=A0AAV7STC0_PLEWA|nr:hypothetical protein NDU88_007737 [Pleurodeles waltl]
MKLVAGLACHAGKNKIVKRMPRQETTAAPPTVNRRNTDTCGDPGDDLPQKDTKDIRDMQQHSRLGGEKQGIRGGGADLKHS